MSLELKIKALAETIATQTKNLKVKQWDLTTLTTTEKNTLVGAINELASELWTLDSDVTTRINTAIATALEWEDLSDLADQILALVQADNWLVSAVAVQTFTELQKTQARTNIWAVSSDSVWNTERDFVTDFNNIYNA
jgi:hypothetical protein